MAGNPMRSDTHLNRVFHRMAVAGICLAMPAAATSCASAPLAQAPDAFAADQVRGEIREAPLRYAGDLEGPTTGHLVIGLQQPGTDGHLEGEALLVSTAGARSAGSVRGALRARSGPGGAPCRLQIEFDAPSAGPALDLRGICSGTTLSGAVSTRRPKRGWVARQIFWWDDADSAGRYWLTRAGSVQGLGTL